MGELDREIAAFLARYRFFPFEAQLRLLRLQQDYLGESAHSLPRVIKLDRQAEALDALRDAAAHVGLADSSKITIAQFMSAPEAVRHGLTSAQVIAAFDGRWNFARRALRGQRVPESAKQRLVLRQAGASVLRTDGYWGSVVAFVAECPGERAHSVYDDWAREKRRRGADDSLPYPTSSTIRQALRLPWKTIMQVVYGELPLAEAEKMVSKPGYAVCNGEHDLVSVIDIIAMSGRDKGTIHLWMHRPDFPAAVLISSTKCRVYHRSDVRAFLDQTPVPVRRENELAGLYVDRREAAKIAGFTPRSFDALHDRPTPIAQVGGLNWWRRTDIEAFRKRQAGPPWGRDIGLSPST